MERHPSHPAPSAHVSAKSIFDALERFLHVEAASGVALITAAVVALLWANSPFAQSYHQLWDAPIAVHLGPISLTQTLHFVINDGLMTIFFLVVGLEIRREMQDGALSGWRVAALPLAAAIGGIAIPAVIYLVVIDDTALQAGWAVPTATDIAFAVGVLALLGKSVPIGVRIFLLAFAVIDDIAAVVIIALFYSGGLSWSGFPIIAAGLLLIFALRAIGVNSGLAYVVPGAAIWFGFLEAGLHPTLAGVVLGLMAPARPLRAGDGPLESAAKALTELTERIRARSRDSDQILKSVMTLTRAPRELLAPVVRVQSVLHPWVAYGVMPLFALANAGVSLQGLNLAGGAVPEVMTAIFLALVLGKPAGILAGTWIAVRAGVCQMAPGLNWFGVLLAACLGGIGFTMSIFIATLAFPEPGTLAAAKLGVLLASLVAGLLGIAVGRAFQRFRAPVETGEQTDSAPGAALR